MQGAAIECDGSVALYAIHHSVFTRAAGADDDFTGRTRPPQQQREQQQQRRLTLEPGRLGHLSLRLGVLGAYAC